MSKKKLNNLLILIALVISSIVIVSWFLQIPHLLSFIPNAPAMQFNTALLFIFLSVSILLKESKNVILQKLSLSFDILILVFSFIKLGLYIFDLNLEIDNLFIKVTSLI